MRVARQADRAGAQPADRLNPFEHSASAGATAWSRPSSPAADERRSECGRLHVCDERARRVDDDLGEVGVFLRERRHLVVQAEQIGADEHLAVAIRTGADADGRHVERRGDLRGELRGNRFEHDGKRAGILQRERIVEDELRLARIASALPIAALLIDRLRQHPEMPHHRNADIDEPPHDLDDRLPAFDFHRGRARVFQQASRVAHRFGRRDLIGQKRHVGDDERLLRAAHDRGGVMNHHVERHRQGRVVSEHRRRDRIADEQHVDSRALEQPRHASHRTR